jgi:thiol-disulfide isomerase/thioredoxin
MRLHYALLSLLLLTAASAALAAEAPAVPPPPTLEGTYLGLSYGPLRQARLVPLPEGTLVRAGAVTITSAQLAERLAEPRADGAPPALVEKDAPYVLERLAANALLLLEAQAWAQAQGKPTADESPGSLLETYLQSVAAQAQVTPEEAQAYYAAHPDLFGGAAYGEVAADLRAYLLSEKQDALMDAHVNSLSARTPVELNAAWFAAHAKAALDTPVDWARRSGRVSLIDFGAGGCIACDQMTPLLEELRRDYTGRANIVFASVRDNPILGYRYNIRVIPQQVLFDASGREVFRHTGFWAKSAMMAKLAELGVK